MAEKDAKQPAQEPALDIKALVSEMRETVQALEQERNELSSRLRAAEEQNRAAALVNQPRGKLEESELPIEALEAFIDAKIEAANAKIDAIFDKKLDPWVKATQAQAGINPDLVTDAMKMLRQNPKMNETFSRLALHDPDLAAEWLNDKMSATQAKSSVPADKKHDASIIRGQESAVTNQEADRESNEDVAARREALLNYGRRTHDQKGVAKELFRGIKVWRPGAERPEELD